MSVRVKKDSFSLTFLKVEDHSQILFNRK